MQVKIIKCHSDSFWYKNNIGQIFNVKHIKHNRDFEYYLCEDFGNKRFIMMDDTIPYHRREKIQKILNNIICKYK